MGVGRASGLGRDIFVVDEFSAPLLPLAALLFLLTELATLRTKVRRFSFASVLVREAILLATFACKQPWAIAACWRRERFRPGWSCASETSRRECMSCTWRCSSALLVAGLALQSFAGSSSTLFVLSAVLLMAAVLMRSGIVPLHCWMTDLFEHASFGTALLVCDADGRSLCRGATGVAGCAPTGCCDP